MQCIPEKSPGEEIEVLKIIIMAFESKNMLCCVQVSMFDDLAF